MNFMWVFLWKKRYLKYQLTLKLLKCSKLSLKCDTLKSYEVNYGLYEKKEIKTKYLCKNLGQNLGLHVTFIRFIGNQQGQSVF